jgi:hypothetical protein
LKKFLFFILACSPHKDGQAFHRLPGEDSSMPVLIGQGFDHLTWTPKGHCVNIEKLETQSGANSGHTAQFRLLEMNSQTALREAFQITASASLRFGLFGGGSALMNYHENLKKNTQSRYLLIHTRVSNQMELASGFEYTESAQKLLKLGDMKKFTKFCGTKFAAGRRRGGEFFALFQFDGLEEEESKHFSMAIKAVGGSWKGAMEIKKAMDQFQIQTKTQYSVYRMGGAGPLPKVEDLEDFGLQFPQMLQIIQKDQVTLELIEKDYTGVEPLDLNPNPEFLLRQNYTIEQLAKNRDKAQEILNDIVYIKTHQEEFLNLGDNINQEEKKILSYINTIQNSALKCFENIFDGCSLPEVPFPLIQLPTKKDRSSEEVTCLYSHEKDSEKCMLWGRKKIRKDHILDKEGDLRRAVTMTAQTIEKNGELFLSLDHPYTNSIYCSGEVKYRTENGQRKTLKIQNHMFFPYRFFQRPLLWPLFLKDDIQRNQTIQTNLTCEPPRALDELPNFICLSESFKSNTKAICEHMDPRQLLPICEEEGIILLGNCRCQKSSL